MVISTSCQAYLIQLSRISPSLDLCIVHLLDMGTSLLSDPSPLGQENPVHQYVPRSLASTFVAREPPNLPSTSLAGELT